MKRLLSFLTLILILFSAVPTMANEQEMRAVWFSYEDYAAQLGSLSQAEFEIKANEICKNIKSAGLNTIIFHVRAFSDAFYNSSYFQYSRYVYGQAGLAPEYDPLSLMCSIAHANGLDIHAWINPYRIGNSNTVTENSVAYSWKNTYGDERVCEVNGAWYYNPASEHVIEYIVEGVREIVKGYDVDGIHFDDYFYPTADESFDKASYEASKTALTLNEWRIENINLLIKKTYDSIKEIDTTVVFGISPNADIEKNYSAYFADVKKWATEQGYVDYLTPQIYFGYKNSTMPFESVLEQWSNLCTVPNLYVGIAAYKAGKEDKWAGDGKTEWLDNSNMCARQIADIRNCPNAKGFMLFCYSPVWGNNATENAKAELTAVKALLTGETNNNSGVLDAFIDILKALFNI
ncbi:MAG: family 10 glycosylhydrolase [Clostridia bacterium]|nr:family 10 glycosylhydrolase [Clostridia bacterium]